MPDDATKVEFLRFGSSIPGAYWGCCACDIIQCFTGDPDAKASIQMVDGDGGCDLGVFAGPTNRDIFLQRLRVGTFGTYDMPNHTFICILTAWQVASANGKKWLKILEETGFEFVRAIPNSVYDGTSLASLSNSQGNSTQYIFMLARNIGSGNVGNPYKPPKQWTGSAPLYEALGEKNSKALAKKTHEEQTEVWKKIGPATFLSRAEVEAAGAPVILAAKRATATQRGEPQELASTRESRNKAKASAAKIAPAAKSVFG